MVQVVVVLLGFSAMSFSPEKNGEDYLYLLMVWWCSTQVAAIILGKPIRGARGGQEFLADEPDDRVHRKHYLAIYSLAILGCYWILRSHSSDLGTTKACYNFAF